MADETCLCDADSEEDNDVMCLRYSPDGHLLAAGFADGYVRVNQLLHFVSLSTLFQCIFIHCESKKHATIPVLD